MVSGQQVIVSGVFRIPRCARPQQCQEGVDPGERPLVSRAHCWAVTRRECTRPSTIDRLEHRQGRSLRRVSTIVVVVFFHLVSECAGGRCAECDPSTAGCASWLVSTTAPATLAALCWCVALWRLSLMLRHRRSLRSLAGLPAASTMHPRWPRPHWRHHLRDPLADSQRSARAAALHRRGR
jgi:hypothetical protein